MKPCRIFVCQFLLLAAFVVSAEGAVARTSLEPSPAKCRLPVASAAAPDEEFPPPPSGNRGYDVQSYDLDIRLIPSDWAIIGRIDIGVIALDQGLTRIRLDLVNDLTCDGVTFGGLDAAFTHQGDSLVVTFDTPLATASPETLTVSWHGRPPRHGAFFTGLVRAFVVSLQGPPLGQGHGQHDGHGTRTAAGHFQRRPGF